MASRNWPSTEGSHAMKLISNLVRAAAFAAFAIGASAFVPATSSEAQAQYGYSYGGGHRVQHHRVAPRHVYRYRHVAPRRGYYRPGVRHYGPRFRPVYVAPQRCFVRSRWVNTYYGPRMVRQRICR